MLTEISTYLKNQDTDIFLGLMPDQPDNCVALFEYAGSPPDLHWNGEYPGLQVRVRDKSYAAGRAKIGHIMRVLHGLTETVLGSTRYLLIRARGTPEILKRDASNRVEFFVNFEIIKERD
ncbi:MAG TPA: minor capsid protein [Oscillospiraceae bacterium]|nr:minor capsid protein [Oscillospiraceae bacterium]